MKALIVALLLLIGGEAHGQLAAWVPHLNQPFVTDTLAMLVGRSLMFKKGPSAGAVAEYVAPNIVLLGVVPDSVSPDYVLAHEIGHMWADANRTDTAIVNILSLHDAQQRIGGYAARRSGEHAAEAFAYAVLILRLPVQEHAPMLESVERRVLGTTLMYERLKAALAPRVVVR
ncbi:MAG: hypothetical protein ACRD3C_20870 [Vicinamibacterales bacterium]